MDERGTGFVYADELEIDLRQYWHAIRGWLWLIALTAVVAGGAAYVVSRWYVEPIYKARTTLLVQPSSAYGSIDYQDILQGQRVASTYAEMLESRSVQEAALTRLGYIPTESGAFKDGRIITFELAVERVRDTQLIQIAVESPDRQFTKEYANSLAETFADLNHERQLERFAAAQQEILNQIAEASAQVTALKAELAETEDSLERGRLELRIAQVEDVLNRYNSAYQSVAFAKLESTDLISTVEPARLPVEPVRPRVIQNTALAAAVGAMLAVGGVFVLEYLDTSVKSPDEIASLTASPVLGQIWEEKEPLSIDGRGAMIVQEKPLSLTAEAFRVLRANLQFASVDRPVKILMVSSAGPTEGKSVITLNLAMVMALTGKDAIVVDADMRKPKQHKYAHVAREPGLSDALVSEEIEASAYLKPLPGNQKVRVLPAGQVPPNPAELLGSQRMGELLKACATMADVVIVDSPPLLAAADAAVLSGHTDGVLLVIEPGSTDRNAVTQATEQLTRAGARLLGTVLNKVPTEGRGSYYYTYHYYYADEEPLSWWQRLLPGSKTRERQRRRRAASAVTDSTDET